MKDINNYWGDSRYQCCAYAERLLNELTLLNTKVKQPINIDEVKKGIYYAKKYHGSQMRQSGEPYYSHPIEVAYMVAQYTALEIPRLFRTDMIVTALLHDTIEDTELTEKMMAYIFGDIVAGQVMDLTRIKEDGHKISSAEVVEILYREKKYNVAFIKIFDRIHNLQTLEVKSPEKAKKIIEETITHIFTLAIHLQIPVIKQQIIELCYQHLLIKHPLLKQWKIMVKDDFQFPETISQNEVTQIYNQYLLES